MGDPNRNKEFTKFILKQFPNINSVLIIGDGKGELACLLAEQNLKVRVIEIDPRFEGKNNLSVVYKKGLFTEDTEIEEDLVIGMHPDDATSEIILGAKKQNKSWAVVPCCIVGKYSSGVKSMKEWLQRLKSLDPPVEEYMLHIGGQNIVLYKRR